MWPIVVFDTNVLVSASLSLLGKPYRCLVLAKQGLVQSVTCAEIVAELQDKMLNKFGYGTQVVQDSTDELLKCSQVVALPGALHGVCADPDDDMIIECAIVGQATHIVTGDKKHLLPLKSYQGIQIITPAVLLTLLAKP